MTRLFGVVRQDSTTTEFVSRQSTLTEPKWTCDRKDAMQVNTVQFAERMAKRFGGAPIVLRGTLRHAEHRPRVIQMKMTPCLYRDAETRIHDAWAEKDIAAFYRAMKGATRRAESVEYAPLPS
jgi:hypothetical protein